MPFFQNIPMSLVLHGGSKNRGWLRGRSVQWATDAAGQAPLPVGHELQDLYEELPQAFPPHLAFQLHFVAGRGKHSEHGEAGPVRGAWGPAAHRPRLARWAPPPAECLQQRPRVLPTASPELGRLPVQDFIPALHVKPEVRKGNRNRTAFPSNEVPGSVIRHFLPFLSVLPAPFALLVPGKRGGSQGGEAQNGRSEAPLL